MAWSMSCSSFFVLSISWVQLSNTVLFCNETNRWGKVLQRHILMLNISPIVRI
jgi:hypothetical protein